MFSFKYLYLACNLLMSLFFPFQMVPGGTLLVAHLVEALCYKPEAGSIPDGVTGIFHLHNPTGRTMALVLTQPVTETSTRNNSCGVKAAGV
jgi:hypothetical protein